MTALVNSSGALQASYVYDPFGRYLAGSGSLSSANTLRFSSKPWVGFASSSTAGLYYYGYRFYDPYLQRWLNRDPIGEAGGVNLYEYVANNPGSRVDPYGLIPPVDSPRWPPIPPLPRKDVPSKYEWLPNEGPFKFCLKGKRRDCDGEFIACELRGSLICSIIPKRLPPPLSSEALMFCLSGYTSACAISRQQCRQWNTKNGFDP